MSRSRVQEIDAQIGAALREARLTAGFTQEELAQALGLTHATIARYEGGTRSLSAAMVVQIAQVLDVPRSTLLADPSVARSQDAGQSGPMMSAIGTVVRVLEGRPDLVPGVLAAIETLLRQSYAAEADGRSS